MPYLWNQRQITHSQLFSGKRLEQQMNSLSQVRRKQGSRSRGAGEQGRGSGGTQVGNCELVPAVNQVPSRLRVPYKKGPGQMEEPEGVECSWAVSPCGPHSLWLWLWRSSRQEYLPAQGLQEMESVNLLEKGEGLRRLCPPREGTDSQWFMGKGENFISDVVLVSCAGFCKQPESNLTSHTQSHESGRTPVGKDPCMSGRGQR